MIDISSQLLDYFTLLHIDIEPNHVAVGKHR